MEEIYTKVNLQNAEDIDLLLEVADITRAFLEEKKYEEIGNLIKYAIKNRYYEMLDWILEIIQEKLENQNKQSFQGFRCVLGKAIENYDEVIEKLAIHTKVLKNDIQKHYDENGEVQSYDNILFYKTKHKNIFLVSKESFDTKDNDSIEYQFMFIP